jgi:hypothetical protein
MPFVHYRSARDFVRIVLKKHVVLDRTFHMFILEVAKLFWQSFILAGIKVMRDKLRLIVFKVFFEFFLFLRRNVFISSNIAATS